MASAYTATQGGGGTDSVLEVLRREAAAIRWINAVSAPSPPLSPEVGLAPRCKDGILLCKFLQAIDEKIVPLIHDSKATFLVKENIAFFIYGAEDFGVPPYKTPSIEDVFLEKDFITVVECLEEIGGLMHKKRAHWQHARTNVDAQVSSEDHLDTEPFSGIPLLYALSSNETVEFSAERMEECQRVLKKHRFRRDQYRPRSASQQGVTDPSSFLKAPVVERKKNVPITPREPLKLSAKDLLYVVMIQTRFRAYLQRRQMHLRNREKAYRARVAKELLETEETYVSDLACLLSDFRSPILENFRSLKLSEDKVRSVFAHLDTIFAYQKVLYGDLCERINHWSDDYIAAKDPVLAASQTEPGPSSCSTSSPKDEIPPGMVRNTKKERVGDVFLAMTAYLKLYTQYVQNFNTASTTLQDLKLQSPGLCKLLVECGKSKRAKNKDISSFLIMPVQRIPRYALLLDNLLKYTPEDHPDYKDLSEAVTKVKDVANYVNEKAKEAENIQKVLNVRSQFQNQLDVKLAEAHRRYLMEGDLMVLDETKRSKEERRHVWLFNDLILIGKEVRPKRGDDSKQPKYKCIRTIKLAFTSCHSMPDTHANFLDAFRLNNADLAVPLVRFRGEDAIEKTQWHRAVREAVEVSLQQRRVDEHRKLERAQRKARTAKKALASRFLTIRQNPDLATQRFQGKTSDISNLSLLRKRHQEKRQPSPRSGSSQTSTNSSESPPCLSATVGPLRHESERPISTGLVRQRSRSVGLEDKPEYSPNLRQSPPPPRPPRAAAASTTPEASPRTQPATDIAESASMPSVAMR
eukprot:CAMPEP_0174240512 /NCGR_PEP_ID=MMETSP0417-20130205/19112_1 /TAXON_ID=242541 /ORGANISM="Mayorella sp, Strain BSH-02190019" /LENGTH=805 /DNA_ID=CAMNT_0015319609 /DNA_START=29 /DNA_END=2443 /DNA_ORIENTATION=+